MQRDINIVVTCTSRKRFEPVPELHLRSVGVCRDIQERARIWAKRLVSAHGQTLPAEEVYCGEHWSVVRSLPLVATRLGMKANLWISSAGYGLVTPRSRIHSYNATFSTSEEDSVTVSLAAGDRRYAAQRWWTALARWEGPIPESPRTITEMARANPKSPLLIIASQMYLDAMELDIQEAVTALVDKTLLLIVSSAYPRTGALKQFVLPSDARFQKLLGGTRASLNVRVAKFLLTKIRPGSLNCENARRYLAKILNQQPSVKALSRKPVSDAVVKRFVRKALRTESQLSASALLRKFRDSGNACEQARFRALYAQTVTAQ
jgi:hypothetical protein